MNLSILQTLSDCCSKIIPLIPPQQHSIISTYLSDILSHFSTQNLSSLNKTFELLLSTSTTESLFYEIYQLFNHIYCFLTNDGQTTSNILQPSYDSEIVYKFQDYLKQAKTTEPSSNHITIVMTTCKRYDLFTRTVISILKYVRDLPQYLYDWIVIDDNSDQDMKHKMKQDFPFIHFIYKDESMKGHPKSLNMIWDLVKTPYLFNIEDDWEFFFEDNYITKMLNIFQYSNNNHIGQVLVNINYSEDMTSYKTVKGASLHHYNNHNGQHIPFWIHNYYTGEVLQQKTNEIGPNSLYWPHFSCRVGLSKMDILRKVGTFNEQASHFEMEYAQRYNSLGYKTAFLNGTFCLHIGRRTYERKTNKVNAYDLNQQNQFGESTSTIKTNHHSSIKPKKIEIRTFVINLKRRIDRLQSFIQLNQSKLTSFDIIEGHDGKNELPSHRIMRCFRSGDYDYRAGIVGCAISHINAWKTFMQDRTAEYAIILEDDVNVVPNFQEKIIYLLNQYSQQFDILMLHQNPWKKTSLQFKFNIPYAYSLSVEQAFQQNMGSAAAYILTRQGATNLINHIHKKGVYNAIDWVIMKTAETQRILYSSPYLVEANCFQTSQADTDIQTEYNKLKWSDHDWDRYELQYLYTLLTKSIYYQEVINRTPNLSISIKKDTIQSNETSQSTYLQHLINTDPTLISKFNFTKTEGIITFLYSSTIYWNKITDYVCILPIQAIKQEDKQQLNRYAIKWFYTNQLFYIIPDKYIISTVLQEKVFGDFYLNIVSPF